MCFMPQSEPQNIDTNNQPASRHGLVSLDQLFSMSWEKTKLHWLKVLKIQLVTLLVILLPAVVVIVGTALTFTDGSSFDSASTPIINVVFIAIWLAFIIGLIYIGSSAQIAMMRTIASESRVDEGAWALIRQGTPLAWGAVLVGLLTALAVFAGLIVFVIGAIAVAVWLSQALFVYVFENVKGFSALKRSYQLVSGLWWAVFGRIIVLQIALSVIYGVIEIFSRILFGQDSGEVAAGLLSIPVSILATPFSLAYSWFIYQDLKRLNPPTHQV